jgi:hypothetical protein
MISELKNQLELEKIEVKEKAAQEKWDAIQKVEKKYKQKALEDFIVNYDYSKLVKDAKLELAKINENNGSDNKTEVICFDTISNEEELYRYLKSNKNTLDDEIDSIKTIANGIFGKLDSKKQKSNMIKKIDKSTYKNYSKKLGLK